MGMKDILGLLGGLAMFLYGMNVLSAALERRAGNSLKSILTRLTSSKFNGFMLGLVVTAVIQSSSATTVMVVGFVNSGIMTLAQSVYIIMGANVGTAVTSWILSLTGISGGAWYVQLLKPSSFTPVLAIIGIGIYMFTKKQKKKDTASIMLGFAVLMFGMEMMSDAVAPLANVPEFTRILTMFSNPILGVLAGAVLTAIIQSSSASVGILQALSLTGAIHYSVAIPVIMGQNIGTCVTAVLSSVGTNRDARRASMVHLIFNVAGTVVWLSIFCIVKAIAPLPFVDMHATPLGIAIVHTAFKILSTAMLMPFGRGLERLACVLVPEGKDNDEEIAMLDERLFVTPSVALERTRTVLLDMARLSITALTDSLDLLTKFDEKKAQKVVEDENKADKYEDKIGTYLVQLSSHSMSESNSHELTKYLHMIGDLERISDHAVNIMESAREIFEKKASFSRSAVKEIGTIVHAVREILGNTLSAMETDNLAVAAQVEPLEQVIDLLKKSILGRHIDRLTHNECTIEMGFVLNDILSNLERVSDHCSNLAVCIIEIAHNSFDTHEYLHTVKTGRGDFIASFESFKTKYALPERD